MLAMIILSLTFCSFVSGDDSSLAAKLPTSIVVILPASVAKNSENDWKGLWPSPTRFWTPTRAQVEKAENALSSRMARLPLINPPKGFHFHEYYTPKYYSRDRVTHIPNDAYDGELVFLDYFHDSIQPKPFHLYVGVKVNGEKLLIVYFQDKPDDFSHRSFPDDFGLLYSLATREFTLTPNELWYGG